MGEVSEISSTETIEVKAVLDMIALNSDDEYETDSDKGSDGREDEEVFSETIVERILALQDAFPFNLQRRIVRGVRTCYSTGRHVASFAASGLWVVATGGTILLLPLMMEVEKESAAVQQEAQIAVQQQQAQQIVA